MQNSQKLSRSLGISFILFAVTLLAQAQATRSWVSGVGDDANPCSRTAPCKTFAGAISKTAASGEINCIDPGGFGAVAITKSITIDCKGTFASILASGTTGIIVNILDSDTRRAVRLRGLQINGAATGINGVRVVSGETSVSIEDSVIEGFSQSAVWVEGAANVLISNSSLRGSATGINVSATGKVRLSRNTIAFNTVGLAAAPGGSIISFKDNVLDGNGKNGAPTSVVALQ